MSEDTTAAKAYDPKLLVEKLKAVGLDVAEDAAVRVVEAVFDWATESAKLSENKIDDVIAALLPTLKPAIFEAIDKIDGEVG